MNELEQAFDRGQKAYLPGAYVINQPDFPWFAIRDKLAKTKFIQKQQPDRILLSRKGSYCFELKQCKDARFPFDRLKPHQEKALLNFQKTVGPAYLVLSFLELQRVFAIPILDYLDVKARIGKKSINLEDVERLAAADARRIREIPVEVPKKNPRLVLRVLFTRTLQDFIRRK
ncbi:MAG: Holliday junction resolvase RecU [Promethearchaeota archaeon]